MWPCLMTAAIVAANPSPAPVRTLDSFCEEAVKLFGQGDLNAGFRTLDAAMFLLRYREPFRPDFEAWKKAHPGELHAFIRDSGWRP